MENRTTPAEAAALLRESRMEDSLEESYRQALEEAKHRPPPQTLLAYQEVFGCFPPGWPPWEEE